MQTTEVVPALPVESTQRSTVQVAKPVAEADRIQTIDLVRGFALLGILMMNIPIFGINGNAQQAILSGPHNTTDYYTLAAVSTLFEGTMRGLFSMLFGAGMILFTMNKKDVPGGPTVAEYYYRRLGLLVLFGLFNAYVLLWEGDILFYYGLAGMLLYPFRKAAAKWLFVLGIVCMLINVYKTQVWYGTIRENRAGYKEALVAEKEGKKLTEKQEQQKAAWTGMEQNFKPDTARINEDVKEMRGNYPTVFSHLLQRNANNETWGTYHGIWDMLSMMFVGMGVFVLGFFSNKGSTSTYAMTLLIGYGIGIPLGWIGFDQGLTGWLSNIGNYVDSYRVPHWAIYDVRRMLLAIGHASLLMLVFRSGVISWLMRSLSNVGQMAFTNYLMQSIICSLLFFGYGLGYFDKLAYHQLYFVVAAVWVFQLIFSAVWLRYFQFGPFEWAWRSLTYWRKQSMKKR
ncbi:MAG: DUF418 domain-containing protein [Chitinophagaceae bacterium]|nr:MAG: DUF418 domain-containing protein [Chitinophagaceae bacterium]